MTEKRFTYDFISVDCPIFYDNKEVIDYEDVADCLNEQYEIITTQKHIIDKQEIRLKKFENALQKLCDMQDPINTIVCKEIMKKELGIELQ